MNIGMAYDFNISESPRYRGRYIAVELLHPHQYIIGAEYSFKKMISVRGGYLYEQDVTDSELRETVFTGPSAGLSVDFPFGEEKKSAIAIDYGYRATNPFSGVHSIGVRLSL